MIDDKEILKTAQALFHRHMAVRYGNTSDHWGHASQEVKDMWIEKAKEKLEFPVLGEEK